MYESTGLTVCMQVKETDELLQAKERKLAEARQILQSIDSLLADFLRQRDSADENMETTSSPPPAKLPKLQVKAT